MHIPHKLLILVFTLIILPHGQAYCSGQTNSAGISLIENKGQIIDTEGNVRSDILFYAHTPDAIVYFFADRISYVLASKDLASGPDSGQYDVLINEGDIKSIGIRQQRIDVSFVGANNINKIDKLAESGNYMNYYLPHCPDGITDVRSFKEIKYHNLYENIDFVVYPSANNNSLKYDFIIKPGGRASDIRMEYAGGGNIEILDNGSVFIPGIIGSVLESKPYAYQSSDGKTVNSKAEVSSQFKITGNYLSIEVGDYDKTTDLIIDPLVHWGTYYGGIFDERSYHVEVNQSNDLFITGNSYSPDFPTTPGVQQPNFTENYDAFVIKLNNAGQRQWATFYGGTDVDYCRSLAIDINGEIIITGFTWSEDFPVSDSALQTTYNGGTNDGFAAKFTDSGLMIWSTYYGGEGVDHFYDVATDSQGNVLIVGYTDSRDFRADVNEFFPLEPSKEMVVLIKLDSAGNYLWATFFGGSNEDIGKGVDVDSNDDIVFSGYTSSIGFPVTDGSEINGVKDAFIAKFSAGGNRIWAMYYGGSSKDECHSNEIITNNEIVFTGKTLSNDIELKPNPYQPQISGFSDAFVGKVDGNGNLLWATYFGGGGSEQATKIATDAESNILVTGFTNSPDFPISKGGFNRSFVGIDGEFDAFAFKFNSSGDFLYWSTCIGDSAHDRGEGIAADDSLNVIVVGETRSINFPIAGVPFQDKNNGDLDVFIIKLCATSPLPEIEILGDIQLCDGEDTILDAGPGYKHYWWEPGGEDTRTIKITQSGEFYVTVADSGGCFGTSDPVIITVHPNPEVSIAGNPVFCDGDSTVLSAEAGFETYTWSNQNWPNNKSGQSIIVKKTGKYTVVAINSNGCEATNEVSVTVNPNPEPDIDGQSSACSNSTMSYNIQNFANHIFRWEVAGGEIIEGQGTNLIRVKWGAGGTGTVVIRDTNSFGCGGIDSIEIIISNKLEPKILSSSGTLEICEGDSLVLTVEGDHDRVIWNNTIERNSIIVKTAGRYHVWVSDGAGCEGRDTVSVVVIPLPQPGITGDTLICDGSGIIKYFSAQNPNYSYQWEITAGTINNGNGSNEIEVEWDGPGTGTLLVTATDIITNCIGESEIYEVKINPNPAPQITADGELEFCEGDSVRLDAGAGYDSYIWRDGTEGQIRIIKESGDFEVTIADLIGCEGSVAVTVTVFPLPPIPIISKNGDYLESTSANSYQWYFNDTPIPGGEQRTILISQDGIYRVGIADMNGCQAISEPFEAITKSPYVKVVLSDTVFARTSQQIQIPMRISKSRDLDKLGIYDYTAYISFNKTLLLPSSNYEVIAEDNFDKSIMVKGTRTDTLGLLANIVFTSAWGNSVCTDVVIDSVVWDVDTIYQDYESGVFCLVELCEAAGIRLFYSDGILRLEQNRPNPFDGTTVIEFETIEKGSTTLILSDVMGRVVSRLYSGTKPGIYAVQIGTSELKSGVYYYSLRTPTTILTRKLQTVR